MGKNKIPRHREELILSLKKHTELLREYYNKAFIEGDKKYYGEIAGKLRLMVYSKKKGQKPLLIGLMDEFKVDIPIVLDGPPVKPLPGEPGPGDKISLERYLKLLAYAIRTPRGLVEVSKIDLVKIWAQQDGSAHEDWKHDEEYAIAKELGFFIGGRPALAAELKVTTETVLHVAKSFIKRANQFAKK